MKTTAEGVGAVAAIVAEGCAVGGSGGDQFGLNDKKNLKSRLRSHSGGLSFKFSWRNSSQNRQQAGVEVLHPELGAVLWREGAEGILGTAEGTGEPGARLARQARRLCPETCPSPGEISAKDWGRAEAFMRVSNPGK
jgi:hypothetical protein